MNKDVLFQEFDDEKAATIQGGAALELYRDNDFQVPILFTNGSSSYVGDANNDQISSIIVNKGIWAFYADANFQGKKTIIGTGTFSSVGTFNIGNDTISSFKRIG